MFGKIFVTRATCNIRFFVIDLYNAFDYKEIYRVLYNVCKLVQVIRHCGIEHLLSLVVGIF